MEKTLIDLESMADRVDDLAREVLVDVFVTARSTQDVRNLLSDLLTEEEMDNVQQRMKACIASLIAGVTGRSETAVCRRMNLNYATYCRARRLWRQNVGGMKLVFRSLGKSVPETRGLKT